MRMLLLLGSMFVGVLSLGLRLDPASHVVALLPAAGLVWLETICWRPVRPCSHCDGRGRDWDARGRHYGQHCRYCNHTGKRFRPAAQVLRAVGAGGMLRNVPSDLQSDRSQ
jgi:hypothetical protein